MKIVMRDVGALQILLGGIMIAPFAVSLFYGEMYNALSFFAAAIITASAGLFAYRTCRDAGELRRHHAMLIAAMGWFISAGFGSLPFLIAAYCTPLEAAQRLIPPGELYESSLYYFRNPLHAFFESMSAYTTTGLTMAVHEPSIGHGLLFYRSFAQWVGGAGVIVLSLAIIPRSRVAGVLELYQSESAGTKLRPSILGTARAIWKIYCGLTVILTVYLIVMTRLFLPEYGIIPTLFDAINHAMAGVSTGGFSTLDDSIAGYQSYAMDLVHIPPMFLGAISIPLYYAFLRTRKPRTFWQDAQFRSMIIVLFTATPLLIVLLWNSQAVSDPIRVGLFQVISGISTTGWQTSNIGEWNNSAVLLLAWGTMLIGGASGATVGGIKFIRAYVLSRAVVWRVKRVFLPAGSILPFRLGERSLSTAEMQREVAEASIFMFLYVVLLGASILFAAQVVGPQFSLADVIFECGSAQGTVGLSAGITDPGMPVAIELLFIVQMWVGRLEIFPVCILLVALFNWRRRR